MGRSSGLLSTSRRRPSTLTQGCVGTMPTIPLAWSQTRTASCVISLMSGSLEIHGGPADRDGPARRLEGEIDLRMQQEALRAELDDVAVGILEADPAVLVVELQPSAP